MEEDLEKQKQFIYTIYLDKDKVKATYIVEVGEVYPCCIQGRQEYCTKLSVLYVSDKQLSISELIDIFTGTKGILSVEGNFVIE